jgi:hypothetical protein
MSEKAIHEYKSVNEIFTEYEEVYGDVDDLPQDILRNVEEKIQLWKEYKKLEEIEQSKKVIEHWKEYRGTRTVIKMENSDIENFLKEYRNHISEKSEKDRELLEILKNHKLGEMSLYLLERIKEDLEDLADDSGDVYFVELYQKVKIF